MRLIVLFILLSFITLSSFSQTISVASPNQKINIALFNRQHSDVGEWYLKVSYSDQGKTREIIPQINLGLLCSEQNFSKNLKYLKAGKPSLIKEQYTVCMVNVRIAAIQQMKWLSLLKIQAMLI